MNDSLTALKLITVSSLEKVFPDETFLPEVVLSSATMLLGERFSFQAAHCLGGDKILRGYVTLSGTLSGHVLLKRIGYAPSELPNYPDADDFVLRTEPGIYPDPLYPLCKNTTMIPRQWNSLFLTIPADCTLPAGTYSLTISFFDEDDYLLNECTFTLTRLCARLPKQTLLHTEWFHSDCIANWYQTPVFSERWWELVEKYAACAAEYGVNMLLTPIFTPALDTALGGERTTVQLVDVYDSEEGYTFSFDKLTRWIAMCDRLHIHYIEFSHLFTQWGAKHTPKIMVYEKGEQDASNIQLVKRFGWETDATGFHYRKFLNAFLPALSDFIHTNQLESRCYFHVSDEPNKEQLTDYLSAKEMLTAHIKDMPIMDAISDYDYYEKGIIKMPICAVDHIEPFLENHVQGLWTYYCCAQYKAVPNRFFCMPSLRNRILGIQLYYFGIRGFLQWGFNFWNTAYSTRSIDPFAITDADRFFPSGDAFLVYPGEDGPIRSLRAEIFMEGLQDMRALELLESLKGRETVKKLIDDMLDVPLTFKEYPRDAAWLLKLRETCNAMIAKSLSTQSKR